MKERKELIGVVVSDKADKTITVKVETYKKHPLYGKRVKYSKKYAAHDENNMAHVGDSRSNRESCYSISSLARKEEIIWYNKKPA